MNNKKLTDNLSNDSPILPNGLTDAEIVKAFKCCADINDKCPECPLKDKNRESCVGILMSNAIDLINRQNAKIEKLKRYYYQHEYDKWEKEIKAEAYKECIEKAKEYYRKKLVNYQFSYDAYCKLCEDLDNLLKELVGE